MIANSKGLIDTLWSIGVERARRLGAEIPDDDPVRQYREDAVLPDRVRVERRDGEDYWEWYDRQCAADACWLKEYEQALADPANMTTEFLVRALAQHYAARAALALSPWKAAHEAPEPEWVERWENEVRRRFGNVRRDD